MASKTPSPALAALVTRSYPIEADVWADFWQRLKLSDRDNAPVNEKSQFFSIRVQVAQDEVELAAEALVSREDATGKTAVVWLRPRY